MTLARPIVLSLPLILLAPLAAFAQEGGLPACSDFRKAGEVMDCACPANAPLRGVWGAGPYTADSDVCTAARHAGVIGAEGGDVRAIRGPGGDSFPGSEANGVRSSTWGRFETSFTFELPQPLAEACPDRLPDGVEVLLCQCDPGVAPGSVWGSGPYTVDSNICTAARHAGVIGADGPVLARRVAGQEVYEGSIRNGVQSSRWGRFATSLDVAAPGAAAAPPAMCDALPEDASRHACQCPPVSGSSGPVLGAGPYDAGSDICAAARHAGVIGREGGLVVVLALPGLEVYRGTQQNGETSAEGPASARAMVFDANLAP